MCLRGTCGQEHGVRGGIQDGNGKIFWNGLTEDGINGNCGIKGKKK